MEGTRAPRTIMLSPATWETIRRLREREGLRSWSDAVDWIVRDWEAVLRLTARAGEAG